MKFLQAALTGMLLGGLHALMAAGLSLSWGVLRIINLTHFGLILIGGNKQHRASAPACRFDSQIRIIACGRAGNRQPRFVFGDIV